LSTERAGAETELVIDLAAAAGEFAEAGGRAEAALLAGLGVVLGRLEDSPVVVIRARRRGEPRPGRPARTDHKEIELPCADDARFEDAVAAAATALGDQAGWCVELEGRAVPGWGLAHLIDAARAVVRHATAEPARPLGELSVLTPVQAQLVLSEFNQTYDARGRGLTIADAFEAQVTGAPDDVAVIDDGVALSYAELNRHANRVAHALREGGG
jgi:non-ribosomal peptide synthetase component F